MDRRRSAPERAPALPPGVDEVRRITTRSATSLAGSAALLAAVDQSISAMETLIARRKARTIDPLIDIALLRFAVTQFAACFRGARGAPARSLLVQPDVRFLDHLCELADQLSGAHARLTGETEVVALLKRDSDRVALLGVATRARRPDRLTAAELANIGAFMNRGREALAEVTRRRREKVLDEVGAFDADALLSLAPADPGPPPTAD